MLQLVGLSFFQGERCLIPTTDLTLEKGTIWAILGESGVGKSTFLHLIAGLVNPSQGGIRWKDEWVKPPKDKLVPGHPDIHLVRQNAGLFPNISLRENLRYALRYYEESYRQQRIDYLLEKGGLEFIQHQLPREVSGGEQQRAAILMAMAEPPGVLLLDEPFSHLDARNKRVLRRLVLDLVIEEETVVIFVTHDAEDALSTAHQISVLGRGTWIQMADPVTLYHAPANEYVAGITGRYYYAHGQLLRPEQIQVHSQGHKALVTESIYLGPRYLIEGSLETGEKVGWYQEYPLDEKSVVDISW